jgi:hypothetical protein
MPTKTLIRWAMPTLLVFQKSNISPILRNVNATAHFILISYFHEKLEL